MEKIKMMKIKKIEESSSAGTKVDSSTKAHGSQVCQPIAKRDVRRSYVNLEKRLLKIQNNYEKGFGSIEAKILDKVDFNFSLQWQPSDGWTIVCDKGNVSPFRDCAKLIEKNGKLSYDDFRSVGI